MKFDVIESIKEFFFDIIGFLLPGLIVILILNFGFNISFNVKSNELFVFVIAYPLGYVIFSLTLVKDNWIKKLNRKFKWLKLLNHTTIDNEIESSDNFKLASKIILNETSEKEIKLSKFRSFRNYAMSEVPESDGKVYTFMFRSDVFNLIHTISVLTVIFGLLINIISIWINLLNTYRISYFYIGFFLLLTFTLRIGWARFYRISMNIPFSIYISKIKGHKKNA